MLPPLNVIVQSAVIDYLVINIPMLFRIQIELTRSYFCSYNFDITQAKRNTPKYNEIPIKKITFFN